MAASVRTGEYSWSLRRDDEGYREYTVTHLVEAATTDGPQTIMNAPGLPRVGSTWTYGTDNDPWAFCRPTMRVSAHERKPGEPIAWYSVTQIFSNKPQKYCWDQTIENPLLQYQRVSGGYIRYTVEATKDRHGALIDSSSHEMFRGPQVEFDEVRPTVSISQNKAILGINGFADMVNKVNDREIWTFPARQIKLSDISWELKWWGTCFPYYTREFTFEINVDTFDRKILDEGTKVLNGHWGESVGTGSGDVGCWELNQIDGQDPDPNNQQHFLRYKDRNGENCRVILNGAGLPANGNLAGAPLGPKQSPGDPSANPTGPPHEFTIEYYGEANFLALGIPAQI